MGTPFGFLLKQATKQYTAISHYVWPSKFKISKNSTISQTGLLNIKFNCYVNAVIQCLAATQDLVKYLNSSECSNLISKRKDAGLDVDVIESLRDLINCLHKIEKKIASPKDFMLKVGKYIPMCERSSQEDAHEFFICLIDIMNRQLIDPAQAKSGKKEPIFDSLKTKDEKELIADRLEQIKYKETIADSLEQKDNKEPIVNNLEQKDNKEPIVDSLKTKEEKELISDGLEFKDNKEPIVDSLKPKDNKEPIVDSLNQKDKKEPIVDSQVQMEVERTTNDSTEKIKETEGIVDSLEQNGEEKSISDSLEKKEAKMATIISLEQKEKNAIIYWNEYLSCNTSPITRFLSGLLQYETICPTCKGKVCNFEVFNSLSLSLPPEDTNCKLIDCLNEFMKSETVSWHCANCKEDKEATRIKSFVRLPKVLVMDFKRFHKCEKLLTKVEIPNEKFSLKNFSNLLFDSTGSTYNLYAVINHFGCVSKGHYYSCLKDKDDWFCFDDVKISPILFSKIQNSTKPYMLYFHLTL